jgi:hypothetical protein
VGRKAPTKQRNSKSIRKGQVPKNRGSRKGIQNKPKDFLDVDELTILAVRRQRGAIALEFEYVFRDLLYMSRGEFQRELKLAKEPEKYASGKEKPLSAKAKKMSMVRVASFRYFDRLMKAGSADIDTTRFSFILDVVTGRNSPEMEAPKSLLERLKEFVEGVRLKGLDFDIAYVDVIRFIMGCKTISKSEYQILVRVAKELLDIELSNFNKIPKREVRETFELWSEQIIGVIGTSPQLMARFLEGCKNQFKKRLPDGSAIDFELVGSKFLDAKVVEGPVVKKRAKKTVKAKKRKTKAKSKKRVVKRKG